MDCVMMFKAILLGKMYNVSDDQLEFLIAERLTFQRFLGLTLDDKVPDAKTIWVYRERLGENGTLEKLFAQRNEKIAKAGWVTREGSLVDATFVEVPKQRNTREENATIKNGEVPAEWKETPNKLRQKDGDARWTKKNEETYYGYKNHVVVDQKSKFITTYMVTDASVHDSQPLGEMLSEKDRVLYADRAYVGEELHEKVQEKCKGINIDANYIVIRIVRVGVAKNSNIVMEDNGVRWNDPCIRAEITDIRIYFRRWANNMILSMATYRQQLQDVATKLADIRRSL
jgi:IS5 family transposase